MHQDQETLDLPALRQHWLSHTSHAYGHDHASRLLPAESVAEAQSRLDWMAALLDFLRLGEDLPASALPDVRPHLKLAQVLGAWLEAADLLQLREVLERLGDYRQALMRAETDNPLRALGQNLSAPPGLLEKLRQGLDDEGQIRDDASPELGRVRRQMHGARR